MENNIKIFYKEEKIAEINSDTPDLSELKSFVLKHVEDEIDYESFSCTCSNSDFDSTLLIDAIKNSLKDVFEKLKINKEKYDVAIEQINKQKG